MADVKNIVTLGIGANPGGLVWFLTAGLESGAAAPGLVGLTARARDFTLTATGRDFGLTARDRSFALTARKREE